MINKEKIKEWLAMFGRPICKSRSGKTLSFARADVSDAERIEKLSDEDLLQQAIAQSWCMEYGGASLLDCQIEGLYNFEISERGLMDKAKAMWVIAKKQDPYGQDSQGEVYARKPVK